MCIMVKTIRHPLEHNKISRHIWGNLYTHDGGEKGRNPTNCSKSNWAQYCSNQFTDEPRIKARFYRYIQVQCWQVTVVHSRYFWWCEVQGTDDTVWYLKVQVQCWQFTVVLSRYFCASVLRKYICVQFISNQVCKCPTGELRGGKAAYQRTQEIICSALHP